MITEARDFEFVTELATQFFAQRSVRRTLLVIREQRITGWEKWLQVEFAAFIQDHENVKAWGREALFGMDKRVEKARIRCAVDFIVHQKFKQSYFALEMKQIDSVSRCTRAMISDIAKMLTIKRSEFDIRIVWSLGVHQVAKPADVLRELNYHADASRIEFTQSLAITLPIGRTGYSFSIV
jgi:hypothetical protein